MPSHSPSATMKTGPHSAVSRCPRSSGATISMRCAAWASKALPARRSATRLGRSWTAFSSTWTPTVSTIASCRQLISAYRCCHPDLSAAQQIALALRIVSGLTVREIARAFLTSESAMEQRITRAKRRIAAARVPFETPGAAERAERLAAVAAMIYLLFNEDYAASGGTAHIRAALCEEAIRLARLLQRLFPSEPESMGLTALLLLQHARARARLDAHGDIVLLEEQDRGLWSREHIAEGLALLEKATRHKIPGPYQLQAALAAAHARAARPEETDWAEIDRLYATLETMQPSPVVTLNCAVAVGKLQGPEAALTMIEPLGEALDGYFNFHGMKGVLLNQLDRTREAKAAFGRAMALARTPTEAAHIRMHLDGLMKDFRQNGVKGPAKE